MTKRFALTVLLAAMLVLAGCSQLATAPNGGTETTAVGSNATTTDVTETTQTQTATRAPTPTIQGQVTTTTSSPTPTATATPSPTATRTATSTTTAAPTAAATPTVTDTQATTGEPKYVVIIGGEPDDKVNYRMRVTGSIERRGQSYGAPIDDSGVTQDPDLDIISGSSVAGRLGGGGDAYRITGEITSFESEGDVSVYVDGEETDVE